MTSDDRNRKSDIDDDQALLDRLEKEEQSIEAEDHVSFADVARRCHIESRICALDDEIRRLKQVPVRGGG